MTEIKLERMMKMLRRLYGYLNRFETQDKIEMDIFYVMSKIIFGDTTEAHLKRLRELIES